ncbi:aminotransferase [Verrucomicrobium sp. GAS474]|uniref:aminotransferase class I/II-fold pyridoxal phosphate-dependent enzyme n=1 Tax=Verrucomicrobium sp. GAS474 TaxID=1882831 RepID=UPI00087D7937|nr:aminotransferase class I/II-fold pyridoxal phosphate-dependent enzyme [Verrucomicrobium sp. GAS474]SDT86814.1 aminotransferase [Verrucomicrobium sp. GAS474]
MSSKVIPFSPDSPKPPRDFIADHVHAIPRSGIRDFFEIVQSMGDVISLGIGEPDFVTPWRIREAAIYSLERGKTGYTSNLGLPKLRKEIASYVRKNYRIEYDGLSEVMVTIGVSEAIDIALRAVLNPGDEVIYHEPCYVSYSPSIALAYGKPVAIATKAEDGFRLRAQDIAAKITPRTKVLMMNFPCNPTGAAMSRADLEPIAALCREHDLLVLTDEIYSELSYDEREHVSIASLPGMRERTIFFHGFSKAFAMTGFRIGYACAPKELTEAMMKIHQYGILCAPITSQEAALEALRHGHDDMIAMRDQYCARRNFLVNRLNEAGLPCRLPEGAFYLFPSIEGTGLTAHEFAVRLLQEEKVAVVPGTAFGQSGSGHIRCSYATGMEQIEIAAERIGNFVGRLKKG